MLACDEVKAVECLGKEVALVDLGVRLDESNVAMGVAFLGRKFFKTSEGSLELTRQIAHRWGIALGDGYDAGCVFLANLKPDRPAQEFAQKNLSRDFVAAQPKVKRVGLRLTGVAGGTFLRFSPPGDWEAVARRVRELEPTPRSGLRSEGVAPKVGIGPELKDVLGARLVVEGTGKDLVPTAWMYWYILWILRSHSADQRVTSLAKCWMGTQRSGLTARAS